MRSRHRNVCGILAPHRWDGGLRLRLLLLADLRPLLGRSLLLLELQLLLLHELLLMGLMKGEGGRFGFGPCLRLCPLGGQVLLLRPFHGLLARVEDWSSLRSRLLVRMLLQLLKVKLLLLQLLLLLLLLLQLRLLLLRLHLLFSDGTMLRGFSFLQLLLSGRLKL